MNGEGIVFVDPEDPNSEGLQEFLERELKMEQIDNLTITERLLSAHDSEELSLVMTQISHDRDNLLISSADMHSSPESSHDQLSEDEVWASLEPSEIQEILIASQRIFPDAFNKHIGVDNKYARRAYISMRLSEIRQLMRDQSTAELAEAFGGPSTLELVEDQTENGITAIDEARQSRLKRIARFIKIRPAS